MVSAWVLVFERRDEREDGFSSRSDRLEVGGRDVSWSRGFWQG